jgi:hypothetical protein
MGNSRNKGKKLDADQATEKLKSDFTLDRNK